MDERDPTRFYDDLAGSYDRMFADWAASSRRQGEVLHALLEQHLGPGPHRVLDCAAGIGTQTLGLLAHGHRVAASDVSLRALRRARELTPPSGPRPGLAAADMRVLPFAGGCVDAVVCADNAVPHLLTDDDLAAALGGMRRVTRAGGLLLLTVRDYDALRAERPRLTEPQLSEGEDGLVVTLQVWHWDRDGERYDLDHLQLRQDGAGWHLAARGTRYRALGREQLTAAATQAGWADVRWLPPGPEGYYQPVLVARAA